MGTTATTTEGAAAGDAAVASTDPADAGQATTAVAVAGAPPAGTTPAGEPGADESTAEERKNARLAQFSPDVQQKILFQRMKSQVAAAISGTSWGKGLDEYTRRGIAAYCHQYGIDPMTELDWLGGTVYVNSEFYLRLLGEMRRGGLIADHWLEHVHADDRIRQLMQDTNAPDDVRAKAARLWYDALFKRAELNIQEAAEAACICWIVLPSGGHPIRGWKEGGNGTSVPQPKRDGGSAPNPIVENNAALSVESQSVRRAMRQVGSHIPMLGGVLEGMDNALKDLNARLAESRSAVREAMKAERSSGHVAGGKWDDLYGLEDGENSRKALSPGAMEPVAAGARPRDAVDLAPPLSGPVSEAREIPVPKRARKAAPEAPAAPVADPAESVAGAPLFGGEATDAQPEPAACRECGELVGHLEGCTLDPDDVVSFQ